MRFYWHYSWETEQAENNSVFHPDFTYDAGSFIMPEHYRARGTTTDES